MDGADIITNPNYKAPLLLTETTLFREFCFEARKRQHFLCYFFGKNSHVLEYVFLKKQSPLVFEKIY